MPLYNSCFFIDDLGIFIMQNKLCIVYLPYPVNILLNAIVRAVRREHGENRKWVCNEMKGFLSKQHAVFENRVFGTRKKNHLKMFLDYSRRVGMMPDMLVWTRTGREQTIPCASCWSPFFILPLSQKCPSYRFIELGQIC